MVIIKGVTKGIGVVSFGLTILFWSSRLGRIKSTFQQSCRIRTAVPSRSELLEFSTQYTVEQPQNKLVDPYAALIRKCPFMLYKFRINKIIYILFCLSSDHEFPGTSVVYFISLLNLTSFQIIGNL